MIFFNMARSSGVEIRRTLLTLLFALIGGALAGAIAGWTVSYTDLSSFMSSSMDFRAPTPSTSTPSTTPDVTVIPVERKPLPSLAPSPFAEERSSAAIVYRRSKGNEDGLLTEDRLIAQAVAVTSDGWFVVPAVALEGLRPADIVVWQGGVAATTTRAILDKLGGVIFLKTTHGNLKAPAFARATDVTSGLAVWLERRPGQFEPTGLAALSGPIATLDGVSSEVVARRGIATGIAGAGDVGAPLWSGNGALIGLAVSAPGDAIRYLPSSAWISSLSSLLASGEIRHALLGVRAADLAWARLDGSRALPERGALLHEDRKSRKPAITAGSPALLAGLRAGDVIQKVDRDILDGSTDLGERLAEYHADSRVTLTVLRNGASIEIPVTLGSIVTSEEVK